MGSKRYVVQWNNGRYVSTWLVKVIYKTLQIFLRMIMKINSYLNLYCSLQLTSILIIHYYLSKLYWSISSQRLIPYLYHRLELGLPNLGIFEYSNSSIFDPNIEASNIEYRISNIKLHWTLNLFKPANIRSIDRISISNSNIHRMAR